MKKLWLVAGLLVAIAAGGWYWQSNRMRHALPSTTLITNAPYSVDVVPDQAAITVNDTVRLHFTARHNGAVADIYKEGRVGHYVIASANYRDFFHTFTPEVAGPGQFYLDHTFTQPGPYRIWVELVDTNHGRELHHGENADLVSFVELTVAGGPATEATEPFTGHSGSVGSYRVVANYEPIAAGKPATVRLHVTNSQGKTLPVFPEEPAIYVMTGPGLDFFRHTHTTPAIDEHFIELTETFPAAGTYLFFAEIYVRDGESWESVRAHFELPVS